MKLVQPSTLDLLFTTEEHDALLKGLEVVTNLHDFIDENGIEEISSEDGFITHKDIVEMERHLEILAGATSAYIEK